MKKPLIQLLLLLSFFNSLYSMQTPIKSDSQSSEVSLKENVYEVITTCIDNNITSWDDLEGILELVDKGFLSYNNFNLILDLEIAYIISDPLIEGSNKEIITKKLGNLLNFYPITEEKLKESLILIFLGADIETKDYCNKTLFILAAQNGFMDIVNLLKKMDADKYAQSGIGYDAEKNIGNFEILPNELISKIIIYCIENDLNDLNIFTFNTYFLTELLSPVGLISKYFHAIAKIYFSNLVTIKFHHLSENLQPFIISLKYDVLLEMGHKEDLKEQLNKPFKGIFISLFNQY